MTGMKIDKNSHSSLVLVSDTSHCEVYGEFSPCKDTTMSRRMQYFRLARVNHVRTNFYRLWLPMSIDFGIRVRNNAVIFSPMSIDFPF